jgi:hypothetical protein
MKKRQTMATFKKQITRSQGRRSRSKTVHYSLLIIHLAPPPPRKNSDSLLGYKTTLSLNKASPQKHLQARGCQFTLDLIKGGGKLVLPLFFLFLATGLFARGNMDVSGQDAGISSRAAIGRMDAAIAGPLFEGNGGKGIRLAVLAPEGQGLTLEEMYLPVYVQGLLNNNFGKYSAISLIDRQNLNQILKEQNIAANGNFSDKDYTSIGNLTNAQYILVGTIQKIPGNQFSVQLAITNLSNGERKAAFMKNSLSVHLQDGTLINQATEELLAQMGIQITDAGKQLLANKRSTMASAEAGLAKGITAQSGGASVEALLNYTQSVAFDPSQMEALSRLNILSTTIGGGTIGAQVLNDIEARKSWLAAFKETAVFFNEHPPFEITFDPGLIQDGNIDYQRETVNLAMRIACDPSEAGWSALNALLRGLEKTGKRQIWGFNGWPFLDLTPKDSSAVVFHGKQSLNFKIDVALLNETGRTIGTSSITLTTGTFRFAAGDKRVSLPEGSLDLVRFPKVDAKHLTPVLTVAISSVNGIPAQTLNTSGYMRISAGDLADRIQRQETANAEEKRRQEAANAEEKRRLKKRWNEFVDNWHPIPPLYFELGYVWEPDYPIGFRIGTFGFYTTWNIYIPDWQGWQEYEESRHSYRHDENGDIYSAYNGGSILDPKYYVYKDIGDREQKSFEWVLGFSINIIDNFLMVPIGIGARHSLEFALFETRYIGAGAANSKPDTEWIPAGKPKLYEEENWESDFLFEIGLEINPIRWISLLATYRLIGFAESSYTLGVCFTVPGER